MALTVPALGGCAGPLSALDPAGPAAASTALLWWIMLAGSAAIFLAVSALLLLAWFRPGPLRRVGAMRVILWGGVAFPTVVLTALVAGAFALGETLLAGPREPQPLRIEATARQWVWEFRHGDRVDYDRLDMPAGQHVDLVVTTQDVIHSFWIPRLGGKIDAIPGHENVIRLRADRPGTYRGVCAEYCGEGHPTMFFTVEAHDAASWQEIMSQAGAGQ